MNLEESMASRNHAPTPSGNTGGPDDSLIWEAAETVVSSRLGSASSIQRKLKVGYSHAHHLLDMLEERGIVGPPNGNKPHEVLISGSQLAALREETSGEDDHKRECGNAPGNSDAIDAERALSLAFDYICQMAEQGRHIHPRGVKTGFNDIDGALGSICPGELVNVCGFSGVGKTGFALNVAVNAAKAGARVLVFTPAADASETMARIISSEARVPMTQLRRGLLDEGSWCSITDASNRISKLDISIYDAPMLTMQDVFEIAERHLSEAEQAIIVVDDLYLVAPDDGRALDDWRCSVGLAAQQLKALARKLGACALATMPPDFDSYSTHPLKGTPLITESLIGMRGADSPSDIVLLINRCLTEDEYEKYIKPPLGTADIYIAKNHYGPVERIRLAFVSKIVRFMNYVDDGCVYTNAPCR